MQGAWLMRIAGELWRGPELVVGGAFRSGTNYLRFLLERNFRCRVRYHAFGWKHAPVPIVNRSATFALPRLPLLFVIKDPYALCVSLYDYWRQHRRNFQAAESWPEFLRSRFIVFDRDPARSPQLRFANPVQYWNQLYWNLAFLPEGRFRAFGLRYEDLLADPEATLRPVATRLGLVRRKGPFERPARVLQRMRDGRAGWRNAALTDEPFDDSHYRQRLYLARYAPADLAFVAGELDPELVRHFGYSIEPAAAAD